MKAAAFYKELLNVRKKDMKLCSSDGDCGRTSRRENFFVGRYAVQREKTIFLLRDFVLLYKL